MRKYFVPFFIALTLFIIMLATNPSKEEYVTWLYTQSIAESNNILEKGVITLFGETVIESATTGKDLGIFTIYTTDLTEIGLDRISFIGVFDNYIPLNDINDLQGEINNE